MVEEVKMLESLVVRNFKGFKDAIEINFSNTRAYDFNVEAVKN